MPINPGADSLDENRPVLAFLTSHWLSVLGSALVTIAVCSWLFLLALHAGVRANNPYLGILTLFIIPAVFFFGLILIPIGVWLARRRLRTGLAKVQSRRIVLRRLGLFLGAMTVVNVVIASQVTYRAVTHMETVQFCGQTCHVMKPQFTANGRSVHRKVGCVECHVVPGAGGFIQAKFSGMRQLAEVTLKDYPRPVPPALQTNRLVSSAETCEQCHSRTINSGSKLIVIPAFKDDEANTPVQTVLMMNVGGGGRAGGIHGAHMGPGVAIRYRTTDPDRQVIPWVEYSNTSTRQTRTYGAAGVNGSGGREFVMECSDCHNATGHSFEEPEQAVNIAMAAGQLPVGLPFLHKTGVGILKAGYSGEDEADRGIPAALTAFYRQKYPDIAASRAAEIDGAGKTLLSLYQANVFPDLGVKWGTYTDNLGHAGNAGCFRCHDESHATPQKKTITQDCSVCHNPLAVEESSPEVLKTLGLDQKLAQSLKQ